VPFCLVIGGRAQFQSNGNYGEELGKKVDLVTHLHGHEEYFDNQRHHRDVVLGVLKGFTREDPFENREKDLNQVVEGLALSLNFKFKCLENTFERAQS